MQPSSNLNSNVSQCDNNYDHLFTQSSQEDDDFSSRRWLVQFLMEEKSFTPEQIYNTSKTMSTFWKTDMFRIFSRILPYKMNHFTKKSVTINVYSDLKYLKLFKYPS
eukprot:396173_1